MTNEQTNAVSSWGASCFAGSPKKLTDKLDRIQRYVCRVIRPDLESSQAQSVLNLSSLEERRLKTSEKCANQMAKDPMFTSMFKKNSREASRNFGQYLEPKWNRKRYGCSSIPFFCRLLNKQQNQSQRMKRWNNKTKGLRTASQYK